jgi:hypothetical protein
MAEMDGAIGVEEGGGDTNVRFFHERLFTD